MSLRRLSFVLLFILLLLDLFARDAREQQRIDYLFASLASLKGAVFIRNGTEYDAAKAQDHLKQKLAYAGDRVKTAEQFIKYCASESSLSHKPYQIRFADGSVQNTSDFLAARLKMFDQKIP